MDVEFCSNCVCPNCTAIKEAEAERERRIAEMEAQRRAKERELQRRRLEAKRLFERECAMVWLLVNTATDAVEANQKLQEIAEARHLSLGQVNTRRIEYGRLLSKRVKFHDGSDTELNQRFAALPGSEGTELPDECPKCGGMKTQGRKCRRCDYKRGSRYVPSKI